MVVLAQNKRSSRNMERSKKVVLTLDIGGSKIRAGRKEFRTPKNRKSFASLLKKFSDAKRVEIGVAGVISGTRVVFSPNIPYLKNFDFQKIFPKTILRVDNDARVFLHAKLETWKSDFQKEVRLPRRVLAFTIGTGIGRALAEKG